MLTWIDFRSFLTHISPGDPLGFMLTSEVTSKVGPVHPPPLRQLRILINYEVIIFSHGPHLLTLTVTKGREQVLS